MEVQPSFSPLITHEVQPFRRFFAKFMLAVPAMITLAVAVQSKENSDSFVFELEDQEMQARFEAYVPLMRQTGWVRDDVVKLQPPMIRQYASMWVQGWEEGKLKALPTSRYADSVYDGVSGQIVRTHAALIFALEGLTRKQVAAGNIDAAASDALLSFRLCRVLRNSDLLLNSVLDVRARRALETIRLIAPKLSQAKRSEFAHDLSMLRADPRQLEELYSRSYSVYLRNFQAGSGDVRYLDQLPRLTPLRQTNPGQDVAPAVLAVRKEMGDVERQMPKRPFETLLAHTLDNEALTQSELQTSIEKLEKPASL